MNPLVSLIVVTYDSADELPALFAALAQTRYAPYEVIVIDNASTDSTVADLAAYPARVVASPTNLGFGRACNLGARHAGGEYLVFLNPDVEVTPDWLDTLVAHAAERPRAILCPATLYPGQQPPPVVGPALYPVAAVPGCALTLSRAWWDELGGFDEAMFLYWEDTELCWRSWLLGGEVLADWAAIVYHQRGASTGFRRWDDERTKNSLYSYLKLLRWRRVLPFAALLAAKTAFKSLRYRQPELWSAWWWNLRHLRATLRSRRRIAGARRCDPAALERLIAAHDARMRRERRQRAAGSDVNKESAILNQSVEQAAQACPNCGRRAWQAQFATIDRLHRLPGTWDVWRCPCGMRALLPQPADPGALYPSDYYAYANVGPAPFFGRGWRGVLRTLALRYHYGYRYGALGHKLPGRGPLAGTLGLLSRPFRRRAALVFGPGPLPQARTGGRVLDVGCANGTWLVKMRSLGWEAQGVEFSPQACAAARAAGLEVYCGDLLDAALPAAHFDVVRIWHTLEHVPDPAATLREMRRILKPGGLLIIGVPNAGGWQARLLGRYWFDLDIPRHLWHWNAETLRQCVEAAGFASTSVGYADYRGFSFVWSLRYWWEERRGYDRERRAAFASATRRLATSRWLLPVRVVLRAFERSTHLEVTARRRDADD